MEITGDSGQSTGLIEITDCFGYGVDKFNLREKDVGFPVILKFSEYFAQYLIGSTFFICKKM